MKRFYIRWAVLLVIFGGIGCMGLVRYNREVKTLSPGELLDTLSTKHIRLMGMIDAGSFVRSSEGEPFRFNLSEEGEKVSVIFSGEDVDDTLRELKTVVMIGSWDRDTSQFKASDMALIPNYGFVSSAYLLSLVPLAFFLFFMERRVAILYVMIKEEKVYQTEKGL
jgi:cytochrome c-type biogenesis protein CcmE